jgi:hypothetical protein
MVLRAILFIALAAFSLPLIVRADDPAQLPTLKASVALPLLNRISPQDKPDIVSKKLLKILGDKNGLGEGGGPQSDFWEDSSYELDDHTWIGMHVESNRATHMILCLRITVTLPNGAPKVLYSFDRTK